MPRVGLCFALIGVLAWSLVGCVVTGGAQVGVTVPVGEERWRSSVPSPAPDGAEDRGTGGFF